MQAMRRPVITANSMGTDKANQMGLEITDEMINATQLQ
jgi:hypothetical protein